MFENFISKILIKLLTTNTVVKEIFRKELERTLADETNIKVFSEISKKESVDIVNSSLALLEDKIKIDYNSKIDSIVERSSCSATLNDTDTLQEQIDTQIDILENTIANNVAQTKKLLNLVSRFDNAEKQIKSLSEINIKKIVSEIKNDYVETNKKTRADVATIVTKVKRDVSDLEIRLDAFIDTISEKIAESK